MTEGSTQDRLFYSTGADSGHHIKCRRLRLFKIAVDGTKFCSPKLMPISSLHNEHNQQTAFPLIYF